MKTVLYKGITLLDGINARPHANLPIETHDYEFEIFNETLSRIDNQADSFSPTMIEIGSWWGFWSLAFRKRFPNGRNVLVELGKRQLCVGIKNFQLNNFSETHYWGGFHLDGSNVYQDASSNYDFEKIEGEYFDETILGKKTGPQLDFIDIYSIEHLDNIDLLHMDIQGSEASLIMELFKYHKFVLKDKIKNIIIATHSSVQQVVMLDILKACDFRIARNEPFGSVGGDGMLVGSKY